MSLIYAIKFRESANGCRFSDISCFAATAINISVEKGRGYMRIMILLQHFFFLFLIFATAVSDIRERKVYNKVVFPCLAAGLILNSVLAGWFGLLVSLEGVGVGFVLLFPFYLLGGMGAGDVKFLMAVGSFFGPLFAAMGTVYGAVIAGVSAIFVLLVKRRLFSTLKDVFLAVFLFFAGRSRRSLSFDKKTSVSLPYAAFLAAGLLIRWVEVFVKPR